MNICCTEKIQTVGSGDLLVLHLDTKCLPEVTFQVTTHEGSVIISCANSLELGLIQPHRGFDVFPQKGSLIYSKADIPVKEKNKKSAPLNKLSDSVNSSKIQSHAVSRVEEPEVIQCMNNVASAAPNGCAVKETSNEIKYLISKGQELSNYNK